MPVQKNHMTSWSFSMYPGDKERQRKLDAREPEVSDEHSSVLQVRNRIRWQRVGESIALLVHEIVKDQERADRAKHGATKVQGPALELKEAPGPCSNSDRRDDECIHHRLPLSTQQAEHRIPPLGTPAVPINIFLTSQPLTMSRVFAIQAIRR
jgi:hypothetical protein